MFLFSPKVTAQVLIWRLHHLNRNCLQLIKDVWIFNIYWAIYIYQKKLSFTWRRHVPMHPTHLLFGMSTFRYVLKFIQIEFWVIHLFWERYGAFNKKYQIPAKFSVWSVRYGPVFGKVPVWTHTMPCPCLLDTADSICHWANSIIHGLNEAKTRTNHNLVIWKKKFKKISSFNNEKRSWRFKSVKES